MNKKALLVIGFLVGILVLIIGVAVSNPLPAPTQATRPVVTATNTIQSTKAPMHVVAPTVKPVATKEQAIQATHGRPQLGGNISDFYGKYGTQLFGVGVQKGTAPSRASDESLSWLVGNNLLAVSYYTPSMQVYSINLSLADWTHAQYTAYLTGFFPDGYEVALGASSNPGYPDLVAYTSAAYPHMFLHLDSGSAYINIV